MGVAPETETLLLTERPLFARVSSSSGLYCMQRFETIWVINRTNVNNRTDIKELRLHYRHLQEACEPLQLYKNKTEGPLDHYTTAKRDLQQSLV